MSADAVELEEAGPGAVKSADDRRPHVPEPPVVRVVAVEDVSLPCGAGQEHELDAFYRDLLGFWREGDDVGEIVYRAENVRIRFVVHEPPIQHAHCRPLGILLPSLLAAREWFAQRHLDIIEQRDVTPGHTGLLVQDPAANWLALAEMREVW